MSDTLVINEIYLSLQGESTFAGLPCIFVRLTACNLRCSYCDTAYAFTEGKRTDLSTILDRINELARELEVKPNVILDVLPELGIDRKMTHSSSLDDDIALAVRQRLTGDGHIREVSRAVWDYFAAQP